MSDGISDGYKVGAAHRELAKKEFGALTDTELRAELNVAEDDREKAMETFHAASRDFERAQKRHELLQSEFYRRMHL